MIKRLFGSPEIPKHANVPLPDFLLLANTSVFSETELKRIFSRYINICYDDGTLSQSRFMYIPELSSCPFAAMAFNYEMEQEKLNSLYFVHFVRILSKLSPKTTPVVKVEYMFNVMKINQLDKSSLSKNEVLSMLKNLNGGSIPLSVLDKIIHKIWDNIIPQSGDKENDIFSSDAGISKAVLTSHLCSLDLQNFVTVQF